MDNFRVDEALGGVKHQKIKGLRVLKDLNVVLNFWQFLVYTAFDSFYFLEDLRFFANANTEVGVSPYGLASVA